MSDPLSEVQNPFVARAQEAVNLADGQSESVARKGLLSQITYTKRYRPVFGVIYGPPGIGKSTFGTSTPNPVFIQTERGLDQISVAKLPIPKDFAALWAQVEALDKETHDFKTIVIDTLDGVEVLIWERVRTEGKVKSIEDYGGGYGKGYVRAREIWTGLLTKLSSISERFNVILLGHSHLKTVNDPMLSAAYDLHKIKIHDRSAEIIRQMVDLILFVNLDMSVAKESVKARKGRGLVSGDRQFWTSPSTGIEAKNRYNLPNPMPFSWKVLEKEIEQFYKK